MPRTTPRATSVKIKRSASTTVPERRAGKTRCSTWSKKSVAYINDSVSRVTAFFARSSSMSRPTRYDLRSPLVNGKALRLQPFLEQRDLRRAAGTIHPFDNDEVSGNFARVKADERFSVEILR